MEEVVLDTSVLVAGLRSGGGVSRDVLRLAIDGRFGLVIGTTRWLESEAVLSRADIEWSATPRDREIVLSALASRGRWCRPYFAWRPNLRDEGDNHLVELALAAGIGKVVTWNVRDFVGGEVSWPDLMILTPPDFMRGLSL
ncbi:PIN domain-containing protein [Roseospira navarrensis]|uniref:PIN domain-containing protein n=1 Tax=Roseospira navarrensis TaxID=140058 RepID=A0A7X1ZCC4_9PROT|nr:PIN domain-containing protein [Roseospira navarrensis]MQX35953.1 PIN domain-containing protein [Roseospira navarrensis]